MPAGPHARAAAKGPSDRLGCADTLIAFVGVVREAAQAARPSLWLQASVGSERRLALAGVGASLHGDALARVAAAARLEHANFEDRQASLDLALRYVLVGLHC